MYFFRELRNQNRSVQNSFDDKSPLKLTFTTRPKRCTSAPGTSTCFDNDMLSTATFFPGSPSLSHPSLGRDENPGNEFAYQCERRLFFSTSEKERFESITVHG